ncbi:hypothetical protein QTP86_029675 [Hemibagrus guttatus]|nr:hypothetical protein QTP86_029675 [Hemibagrus guttatus]
MCGIVYYSVVWCSVV